MDSFLPYFTGDKSVGLYSNEFDDIYHSAYGALSEAYEKFVLPLKVSIDNIRVLDICFGLGYNSKAFLNKNKNKKITFDCLDIDKELMLISPFIRTNKKNLSLKKEKDFLPEKHKIKIKKYIRNSRQKKYIIEDWVNHILIKNLYEKFNNEIFIDKYLCNSKFSSFFENNLVRFAKFYAKWGLNSIQSDIKQRNLHNIYYRYLSYRYKYLENNDIKFNFYVDDARNTVKKLTEKYDYIFLDAFTTDKCPQLWSLDFINELYRLSNENGILITYSTSAIVRNTMIEAGFYIGKIIDNDNKSIGTICSKNKNNIKNPLNNYELGLLKTKAGIPYRDFNLSLTKEEIITNREDDVNKSNLITSSKYIKKYKGVLNEI